MTARRRVLVVALGFLLLASGCAPGTAGLLGEPPGRPLPTVVPTAAPRPAAPPSFPRDEAPHQYLTEWWYYTGHLRSDDGRQYGFELVFFLANRAGLPPQLAQHFAITDVAAERFRFAQGLGGTAHPLSEAGGFDLRAANGWRMRGQGGEDHLRAEMSGYAIELALRATKPPALHNHEGLIDFGPVGFSYYYSYTRMEVTGTLRDGEVERAVVGQAWMDHQWGDFIVLANAGWDWFSAQLDDGSEFTLSIGRDPSGGRAYAYGTYVAPDGRTTHLSESDFTVTPRGTWTSPRSDITYPSGWGVEAPALGLDLEVQPVLLDQELNAVESTGLHYWEGAVTISGLRHGAPVSGVGYVELTGYLPAGASS